jgi:large subunit ribosomal protein L35
MKQKTSSVAKKRIRVTGSGKLKVAKAAKNHLLSSKSKRQKNSGRLGLIAPAGHTQTLKRMLAI